MRQLQPLSRWLGPLKEGRGVLLWGEPLRPLAAAAAAWGVARGSKVLVVDAANRFDPYQLVREARARGLAPRDTLSRVQVARAFTCHQLVRLLQEGLPYPLEPGTLLLVLGPVSLFYDEQVPLAERRRLFRDLISLLTSVKAQAPLLLMQPTLPRGATNRHFGRLLAPLIDYFVKVEERDNLRGGPGDLRSPTLPSNSPPNPLKGWPGKAGPLAPTSPAKQNMRGWGKGLGGGGRGLRPLPPPPNHLRSTTMGRTVLPYSQVWEEERQRWLKFRRALRREDQVHLDRLFELARLHLQAGVYASQPWPLESMLLSMLLEHQKVICALEERLRELETGEGGG